MGGSSESTSEQKNETTTNQTDRRIGATDSAVVIAAEPGASVHYTETDDEALSLLRDALAEGKATLDTALETVSKTSLGAVDAAAKAAEAAGTSGVGSLVKWGVVGAVAYGVLKKVVK